MNKVYKSILGAAAAAIVAGASMAPVAVNAWGDSNNGRQTYTIADINANKLGDTITFNSITDGKIGDERNFVGARYANATTTNGNTMSVSDGDVVTVRLYVHNNNKGGMNAIATGVKARFSIPTTVSNSQTIVGYISADNANPGTYWDEVELTSSDTISLEYVYGSAQYRNALGTFAISDEVVAKDGVYLGYTSMNGEIPGCYDYDGELTIQVKIHSSVTAKLQKYVRIKGTTEWKEMVEAKVGEEVEYKIEYVNRLTERATNVMIRDVLPTNMEYVAGSTYLYNSNHQNGSKVAEDTVTTTGINIGNYVANGNAVVVFTAKVVDKTLACGSNQLVNWASSTVNGRVTKDDASVMVVKNDGVCKDNDGKTTTDNNGGTTKTIVSTGPETIVTGTIGAGATVTALGYFIASRKKLM